MGKPMPKYALPRNHKKHPSGLHDFLTARKHISQQLDTIKTRLGDLYVSEDNVRNAVFSHIKWLDNPPANGIKRLPQFIKALQNVIAIPMESYVVLRCLQQETNHLRRSLSVTDATGICCCRKGHFIQDITALGDIIKFWLMTAFRCSSIVVNTDLRSEGRLGEDESDTFWTKVEKIDKHKLLRNDKLLSIMADVLKPACCILDQYDAFQALIGHLTENRGELDRFEPTQFRTITEYVRLYYHLKECSITLCQGRSCTGSCGGCKITGCGLHGFLEDMAQDGPMLFVKGESSCAELAATVTTQFLTGSQKIVELTQLWDAIVRWSEEACALYSIGITKQSVRFKPKGKRGAHSQSCNPYGLVDAGIVVSELLDFLRTKSRKTPDFNQEPEAQMTTIAPSEPHDTCEPCSMIIAADHSRTSPSRIHAPHSCLDPTASEDNSKSASQARNSETPCTITEKQASFRVTNNGEHERGQSRETRLAPRDKILAKYHQRGYGKMHGNTLKVKCTAAKDINQRIWITDNPTEYYEVWRIIFPLTKSDRLISRVSWRLFRQAMESPPVNCRLKKAQAPVFVWERDNGVGGNEIFQCHAPHALDWIPINDLYRYRKDLRDAFGMDGDRIRLKGKTYNEMSCDCSAGR